MPPAETAEPTVGDPLRPDSLGELLRNRQLRIAFRDGRISRGDGIETFHGAGSVHQDDQGQLTLDLDATETRSLRAALQGGRLGQIVPDGQDWHLEITDDAGRRWTSAEFSLRSNTSFDKPGTACSARLRWIRCIESGGEQQADEIVQVVRSEVKIPCNRRPTLQDLVAAHRGGPVVRDMVSFSMDDWEFEIVPSAGSLQIRVWAIDRALPENFELRVIESLQFVLGCPLHPSVLAISRGRDKITTIAPDPGGMTTPRAERPIQLDADFFGLATWDLFGLYLRHVLPFAEDRWHPLSGSVYGVQSASMLSMETEAIKLGVEVERTLNREFRDLGVPDSTLRAQAAALREHVKAGKGFELLREKVLSDITRYERASPSSRLKELEQRGLISGDERRAWHDLRNTSAHGGDLWSRDHQELVQLHGKVLTLFHRLIFAAVGYSGPYTNYGELGWPIQTGGPSTKGA